MDDAVSRPGMASGPETQLAASAVTGEHHVRATPSTSEAVQKEAARPAAGEKGDSSSRSRGHRSSSSTPKPASSSRRHRDRRQSNSSPGAEDQNNRSRRDAQQPADGSSRPRALLSCCKGETHSHREGFRRLARRLHDAGWQPEKLNPRAASLADGPVTPIALQGAALAIFGCPTRAFMPKEIAALHSFVDQGGSLAVFACAADSSEADVSANLNQLLGRYSIAVNRDALFSIVQQGALHPRHVLVSEGPLCTAITAAAAQKAAAADSAAASAGAAQGLGSSAKQSAPRHSSGAAAAAPAAAGQQEAAASGAAELLFCDGCTLAVSGAAHPLLLSGSMCNPPLRPLAASWRGERGGRVAVLGSAAVFDGETLRRPGNAAASDLLFQWLRPGSDIDLGLPPVAADGPKACRRPLDILEQSEQPRVCFQLEPLLPGDWTQLFAEDMFEYAPQLPPAVSEPSTEWHQNSWHQQSAEEWHV